MNRIGYGLVPVMSAAVALLSACGSGNAETTKRLDAAGPCELVTPTDLTELVGNAYGKGEAEGSQCFYSPEETLGRPLVTIGAGIVVTNVPDGTAVNAEVTDTEVGGVTARQMTSTPRGSSCTIEVALVPDDTSQTFSAGINGMTGGDPCEPAKRIASHILEQLPG